MSSSRQRIILRLILAGAAAAALTGCASNGDYYYGPDTAYYYDQPANYYYGGLGTISYYEQNRYSPAPRYSTHVEQRGYWYYPGAEPNAVRTDGFDGDQIKKTPPGGGVSALPLAAAEQHSADFYVGR